MESAENPVILIAKKEIMDDIRNFRIIMVTSIFVLLTLVTSYFGSTLSTGWHDLGLTIAAMWFFVLLLIPILAIMLGYATIVGEIERGSMGALLSLPVSREEVVLGKFLGLGGVLSISILLGFGFGGVVIGAMVPNVNWVEYLIFIFSTVLYGSVYLSISMFFSTLFKKRSTALGGAIFLWIFFHMILPLVLRGIAVAGMDVHSLKLIDPLSVYSTLLALNIEPLSRELPSFYTTELMVGILILWIVTFLILTMLVFRRKDV